MVSEYAVAQEVSSKMTSDYAVNHEKQAILGYIFKQAAPIKGDYSTPSLGATYSQRVFEKPLPVPKRDPKEITSDLYLKKPLQPMPQPLIPQQLY